MPCLDSASDLMYSIFLQSEYSLFPHYYATWTNREIKWCCQSYMWRLTIKRLEANSVYGRQIYKSQNSYR
jgi:hypothetical protein